MVWATRLARCQFFIIDSHPCVNVSTLGAFDGTLASIFSLLGDGNRCFTLDVFAGEFYWTNHHSIDSPIISPTGLDSTSLHHKAVLRVSRYTNSRAIVHATTFSATTLAAGTAQTSLRS